MLAPMREPDDDRELMLRYAGGDATAFEQLYGRHKGGLFRYFARQTGNDASADELFQETWMKVIGARHRYQPTAKFSTWLYQVAHNCFIDHCRRQGRNAIAASSDDESELHSPQPGPEAQASSAQVQRRFLRAMKLLPDEQREAFLLKEEGGFTLEEIGTITGVGRETVKSRLRYAVNKLRATLEKTDD
ncbi:MAG: RNA polymerase sigma factor [Gammaproteobacteria bacterium]|nr:RNA polymerase sigma factor [Gammaproteobacteria bacterium]